MTRENKVYDKYPANISRIGLSIYDPIEVGDPDLWIPTPELEMILNDRLIGLSLLGLPLRTRSKVLKSEVCQALGYQTPSSFKKTHPGFPGQQFDTYIQKADNLQIWNEEISPTRRYVIIRVSSDGIIERIRVITGDILAQYDKTGTLTQKYQARFINKGLGSVELIASQDTDRVSAHLSSTPAHSRFQCSPLENPMSQRLLPIKIVFDKLASLVGMTFADVGYEQERRRGMGLHRLVCQALGYDDYQDDGRFPDLRDQLLEVKLQTSPTIDLGLVLPNATDALGIVFEGDQIRPCDIRYAVFYAETDGKEVKLTHFCLTTGQAFFTRFPQFEGRYINSSP